jgi:magnesium-transporting ATPase (P-type)
MRCLSGPPVPLWRRFVRQFNSPLIFILLFALAFDARLWVYEGADGWPIEASAIALILLFNALLGVYQEQRSDKSRDGCWPSRSRCARLASSRKGLLARRR